MKYYFATHLDVDGVVCAALLLRKYDGAEVEIDFLIPEEAIITEKMYDIVCSLPKPKNAKVLIGPQQGNNEIISKLDNVISKDIAVKKTNVSELLREQLGLEDEISKQIAAFGSYNNIDNHPEYQELDLVIHYICSSQKDLFSFAKKWALLGNRLFLDDYYQKTVIKAKNEREIVCRKLRNSIENNMKNTSQIVIVNTLGLMPYKFAEITFDYLFDHGVKVACLIYCSPKSEIGDIEVSIRVNPSYFGKFNVLPIAHALGGVGSGDWARAKAHKADKVIGTIIQKIGSMHSFCYFTLNEEKTADIFPYDKVLCIEASMKQLSSNELKSMIFPNLEKALNAIFYIPGIDECVIIQKCNCVEIYVVHHLADSNEVITAIKEKWEQLIVYKVKPEMWEKIKIHHGKEAIYHLYRVTSSLESLIIGDNPVFSQVTSSYNLAVKQKTVKDVLSHIFKEAFTVAKKVYANTQLHGHGVSIGRVAVALLMTSFSKPAKTVTVVGSGQIGEIVVNAIQEKWKFTKINIITQRPEYVSKKYKNPLIKGLGRVDLINCASVSDAIILCTDSKKPIISAKELQEVTACGKLKVLIDLGMPPNAESVENISLSIYSLANVVKFGKIQSQQRLEEAKVAEDIINQAYNDFEETIFKYKNNKILKKLGSEIHKAAKKNDIESSIMGILIRLFRNLSVDELSAIELAVDKISQE